MIPCLRCGAPTGEESVLLCAICLKSINATKSLALELCVKYYALTDDYDFKKIIDPEQTMWLRLAAHVEQRILEAHKGGMTDSAAIARDAAIIHSDPAKAELLRDAGRMICRHRDAKKSL